jgi:hypothetical protein
VTEARYPKEPASNDRDSLDEIELWNREDAEELQRPKDPKQYDISIAARDWTVDTIVSKSSNVILT